MTKTFCGVGILFVILDQIIDVVLKIFFTEIALQNNYARKN